MMRLLIWLVAGMLGVGAAATQVGGARETYSKATSSQEGYAVIALTPARSGDTLTVAVGLENSIPVAGLQLDIECDTTWLAPREPRQAPRSAQMQLGHSVRETGPSTILLVSLAGDVIPEGTGTVLDLRFSIKREGASIAHLKIQPVLSDELGDSIPFEMTGIEEDVEAPAPRSYELEQNVPNPFNSSTRIGYTLGEKAQVCLTVYDVKGRVARVLTAGQQSAGRHEALWDGTDEQGLPTGTGLYLYSLSAGDAVLTRKAVLMK